MWQPIETAPLAGFLLLYGRQRNLNHDALTRTDSHVFTGYWDPIDSAWCADGSTWAGPFYDCTHWAPRPTGPEAK